MGARDFLLAAAVVSVVGCGKAADPQERAVLVKAAFEDALRTRWPGWVPTKWEQCCSERNQFEVVALNIGDGKRGDYSASLRRTPLMAWVRIEEVGRPADLCPVASLEFENLDLKKFEWVGGAWGRDQEILMTGLARQLVAAGREADRAVPVK